MTDRGFRPIRFEQAEARADAAFDFFRILGVPFFCFHDHDVRPEGDTLTESRDRLNRIADIFEAKMAEDGKRSLWGAANMFSNRHWMSGAATNPDPLHLP